jgi:glutamate dehydrogenase (NAD(P)+)
MADSVFRFADDLGPQKIVHIYEPSLDLKAILVVDNVAAGPSIGGTRMAPDVSLEECVRLARAMTLKNAAAGLPHGGGKSVIFADPSMSAPEKEQIMRAFAGAIGDIADYIPGPDMGTDEQCMGWVKDEIGRAAGLPREIGGIPLDEIGATGFGLAVAANVAKDYCGLDLKGARVAIQGFGAVGRHAARFLAEQGAVLVAAADSAGTLSDPNGLDIAALIDLKRGSKRLTDAIDGEKRDREAIVGVDCDIWIPAARPDVLHEGNVEQVKARIILEGANIPATEAAERRLHERGVLVIPDFIANAGGVICAAVEFHGGSETAAFEAIEEKITRNTREVLEAMKASGAQPRDAAVALAEARLRKAMSTRRWLSGDRSR